MLQTRSMKYESFNNFMKVTYRVDHLLNQWIMFVKMHSIRLMENGTLVELQIRVSTNEGINYNLGFTLQTRG